MENYEKIKEIRDSFLSFYMMAGYKCVDPAPLIPENDDTIYFSNSAIVPFKKYLQTDCPRLTVAQKCLRFRGGKNLYDLNEHPYVPYFNMVASITNAKHCQEVAELTQDFLLNSLNIPENKLYADVSSQDPVIIKNFEKYFDLHVDKLEQDEYRWGFGINGVHGRGLCFSMRYGDNKTGDLGQIIQINSDNNKTNYAFGFGIEKFIKMSENLDHFYEATSIYEITKDIQGPLAWRYMSSLSSLCYLYSQNIDFEDPKHKKQNKIVSSLLHQVAVVSELMDIPFSKINADAYKFSMVELNKKTNVDALLRDINNRKQTTRHNKEFQQISRQLSSKTY